jgi:hypothetical protein
MVKEVQNEGKKMKEVNPSSKMWARRRASWSAFRGGQQSRLCGLPRVYNGDKKNEQSFFVLA